MDLSLAINAVEEELPRAAAFCRERALGLEVTAFAFPKGLDDGFDRRVQEHTEALQGITPISFHGPFMDLYPASADPAIVHVARDRHERAFGAALTLGAKYYVAHVGSIPFLTKSQRYRDRFVSAMVDFWHPFAERASDAGMVIALENLWETGPSLQKAIVEQADHPGLRASFDNGHCLVFGARSSSEWLAGLGSDLAHCHLHDNDGSDDQHLPIGEGREDWSALFSTLRSYASHALIVLESDRLERNGASLEAALQFLGTSGAA